MEHTDEVPPIRDTTNPRFDFGDCIMCPPRHGKWLISDRPERRPRESYSSDAIHPNQTSLEAERTFGTVRDYQGTDGTRLYRMDVRPAKEPVTRPSVHVQ